MGFRPYLFLLFSILLGLAVADPFTYPNYQSNREFWMMNGHTADPCVNREELLNNNILGSLVPPTNVRTDCVGPQLPDPSVTVLIPSFDSVKTVLPALTITGRNLSPGKMWLSYPGGDCQNPETSLPPSGPGSASFDLVGTSYMLSIPDAWRVAKMELEVQPRKLCYATPAGYVYTGFKIGIVYNCDDSDPKTACKTYADPKSPLNRLNPFVYPLSPREQALRALRTKCIRHTVVDRSGALAQLSVGQCVNPNVTGWDCQGAAYDPITMKCCDSSFTLVQWKERPCYCRPDAQFGSPQCPGTEPTCCTHTKYPELLRLQNTVGLSSWPQHFGECYNSSVHRCCDTGYRYDPGQDQCCNITGIQSLNVPCPCQSDADCQGGQTLSGQGYNYGTDNNMYCCNIFWPDPYETGDAQISKIDTRTAYPRCNKYINYPSTGMQMSWYPIGTGPYQAQRCLGICIDNRYQTCCNGVACRKEYEVCCNSTCCNKFTSTCTEGRIPGTPGATYSTASLNSKYFNYNELDQPYEICTSIEVLNPLRGFWVFVWPAYQLLMTAVCTAFAIAYINKVSRRSFSFLERAMITIAFLTIIFGCACYFAPIYKYGIFLTIVNLFTIITACARAKQLNLALVIVQFITVMYLFDPFTGNNYLGFAAIRVPSGDPDPETAGVLYSIQKMMHSLNTFNTQKYCHNYYDYFMKDPQLEDPRRDNMMVPSFGYCGHGWITALYIFEGIALILTLIQFLLNLIALILRYKEERSEEFIRLEPEPVEYTATPIPVAPVAVAPATPYFPAGFAGAPLS